LRKSVIKFAVWAVTAVSGIVYLIKGIRWLLDLYGTAQTAEGIWENKVPVLNQLLKVSQAWPLSLFLVGVFALACIQFGSPMGWLAAVLNESPDRRQALLVKIRDLVLSSATGPLLASRYDEMGSLIRHSDEFKDEKHVLWTCNELKQGGFKDPFEILGAPRTFKGRRLQFLRDARTGPIEITRISSALSFAVKYWRHSDKYKKERRALIGWPEDSEGESESLLSEEQENIKGPVKLISDVESRIRQITRLLEKDSKQLDDISTYPKGFIYKATQQANFSDIFEVENELLEEASTIYKETNLSALGELWQSLLALNRKIGEYNQTKTARLKNDILKWTIQVIPKNLADATIQATKRPS
jgi:hypothetical protein